MSSALNKRIVLTAEPKDRPYELRDAQFRGLFLRVQSSGRKAWPVTWAHGKRRTLGSVDHLTLDQARDQARQAVAEYVQSGLPALAQSKPTSCTLEALLNDHFEPWAIAELKGGRQYPGRIRSVCPWLLRRQIIEIDVPTMERWWRGRITGPDAVTKATAARDFACLRSALSRAVEWKLIDKNPLMGIHHRSAASRKVERGPSDRCSWKAGAGKGGACQGRPVPRAARAKGGWKETQASYLMQSPMAALRPLAVG